MGLRLLPVDLSRWDRTIQGGGGATTHRRIWYSDWKPVRWHLPCGSAEDPNSEEPPESPEEYHAALFAAQKPVHAHIEVTQLDGIARLMALKANHNMSIICFNELLLVIASLLPKENILPKNMYESNKILGSLKMPYDQIHACPNGCMLFWNEHKYMDYCV